MINHDRCDQSNVIYQAGVYADNKIMRYYGSTELQFKKRYSKHKSSFKKKPEWDHPFKTSAFFREGEGSKIGQICRREGGRGQKS